MNRKSSTSFLCSGKVFINGKFIAHGNFMGGGSLNQFIFLNFFPRFSSAFWSGLPIYMVLEKLLIPYQTF